VTQWVLCVGITSLHNMSASPPLLSPIVTPSPVSSKLEFWKDFILDLTPEEEEAYDWIKATVSIPTIVPALATVGAIGDSANKSTVLTIRSSPNVAPVITHVPTAKTRKHATISAPVPSAPTPHTPALAVASSALPATRRRAKGKKPAANCGTAFPFNQQTTQSTVQQVEAMPIRKSKPHCVSQCPPPPKCCLTPPLP
jgi:hypothetical protein